MSDAADPHRDVILVKPQQTEAMRHFETNISLLVAFLYRRKPNENQRRAKSAMRVVGRYKADQTNIAPLERANTKLNEATSDFLKVSQLSLEWMSVMLVSFSEAYLEDRGADTGSSRAEIRNPAGSGMAGS